MQAAQQISTLSSEADFAELPVQPLQQESSVLPEPREYHLEHYDVRIHKGNLTIELSNGASDHVLSFVSQILIHAQ